MARQYSKCFKTPVNEILHQELRPSIFFDKSFISLNVLGSYFVYANDIISRGRMPDVFEYVIVGGGTAGKYQSALYTTTRTRK
jgi:hypothetical protein